MPSRAHGLFIMGPLWDIKAWVPGKESPRLSRVDRILQPEVIDIHFVLRPHEFVSGVGLDMKPFVASRIGRSWALGPNETGGF